MKKHPSSSRRSLLSCLLLLLLAIFAPRVGRAELEPVTRVLLVGNSYTHFHMLHRLIERIAASAGTPLRVDAVTHGGYSLRMHWQKSAARERIASRAYRFVVLQDHSLRPVDHLDEFDDYGERFARAIVSSGAQPVLYQTWPRSPHSRFYGERERSQPRSVDEMAARLEQAYGALATREGARLAPVGRAFTAGLAAHPELELYSADGTHPSWAGSYLAACVLYGTLTGNDPRRASYAPWELPAEQAPVLRALAAQVLTGDSQPVHVPTAVPAAPLLASEPNAASAPSGPMPVLHPLDQPLIANVAARSAQAATAVPPLLLEPPAAHPAGTALTTTADPTAEPEPPVAPPAAEPPAPESIAPAPEYLEDVECNDDLAPQPG
jgi:hypothetical protein